MMFVMSLAEQLIYTYIFITKLWFLFKPIWFFCLATQICMQFKIRYSAVHCCEAQLCLLAMGTSAIFTRFSPNKNWQKVASRKTDDFTLTYIVQSSVLHWTGTVKTGILCFNALYCYIVLYSQLLLVLQCHSDKVLQCYSAKVRNYFSGEVLQYYSAIILQWYMQCYNVTSYSTPV